MRIISLMKALPCVALALLSEVFCSIDTYGQVAEKIHGSVHTTTGEPVSGASIIVAGTRSGTQSDEKGDFVLTVKQGALLEITHVGYNKQEVRCKDGMDVVLTSSTSDLSQVVVVGYGSQSRRKVTGAISTLDGDQIKNIPEVNFDALLQGKVAGVSVQSSTGEPGAKTNIVIRGTTNVDYANTYGGNTQPLYVIDGVIYDVNNMGTSYEYSNPLSLIDPNDIESIEVLKDASAAAIYGARGGNGVIVVKTRRADRNKKPQISFETYGGFSERPDLIKVLTGTAERDLKLALLNSELPYTDIYNGDIPIQLTDSLNAAFNGDVDWQGMMIRKNAFLNNEKLTISGFFNNNNSYRLSIGHYNEQGAVKGYGTDRVAPSLNLNLNPVPRFNVSVNLEMAPIKVKHGAGVAGDPYAFSTWSFPTSLVVLNPETVALYNGSSNRYDDDKTFSINGNIQLTDTIAKTVTLTSSYGYNNYTDKYDYFSPVELNGTQNIAYDINSTNPNWTWETYGQFHKNFGKNDVTAVGGFSAYKAMQYYSYAYAAGIDVSNIYTLETVPSGTNLYATSSTQTKTTESYYGRLNYDYAGKYLFTASLRRDASSIYSANYRWGTFYSLSTGWILSDEKFFQSLKKVVNFLKVRASYGITGQDPGSWYAKYQTLYADASYLGATTGAIGGTSSYSYLTGTPSTYNGTTVISPFLYNNGYITAATKASSSTRWEKYPQADLGVDWNMFNDRLTFQFDWYQKDADDKYVWQVPAEATSGYAYYSGNYINVRNRGLELSIVSRNTGPKAKLQWITNFNISYNKNWITKLPNGGRDLLFGDSWFRKTLSLGDPLFAYRLWQAKGVYKTDADVPTDPITGNKMTFFGTTLVAGDPAYVDQNGDYNITYDDQYSTHQSAMPKLTGGMTNTFTYKNFNLSFFISYSFGNKLLNGTLSDALNGSAYSLWGSVAGPAGVYYSILKDFWQQSGDNTVYPRLVYGTGATQLDPWNISNSYFLENGGYIKLKQITLGYNLPRTWTSKIGINGINIYAVVYNVATWKQSKNLNDPEIYDLTTGSSNASYPLNLKLTLGLNVNL